MMPASQVARAMGTLVERPDLESIFEERKTTGALVVYDVTRDMTLVYNPSRAATEYSPASTFKIFNSLIALETAVINNVDTDLIPGDGKVFEVNGKSFLPAICNGPVRLRVAFANSCIPAYQEIARRVGAERYRQYLAAARYGNQDHSGPVDGFWLTGDLRISAYQQIEFLKRLVRETLPFSAATYAQVKDIMMVERTPMHTLRGKTGYVYTAQPAIGWWVGWVERGPETHLFAMNIDLLGPEHGKARTDITKEALRKLGILWQPP